jgi:ribosomal protein L31
VVSPQLSWILDGEVCQKCFPSKKTDETKINLEKFRDDFSKKFGKGIAKRAIELKLLRQGFYTQPKRVMQAEKYIEQFFNAKKINLEELAELYGLKERTTKLFPDKQPLLVENA